jgi:hypothetical protein
MLLRLLADAVVLLHVAFVAFVVLGGLLALRWRRAAWIHLPAAFWGFLVEARGLFCPLTDLENHLRRQAGQAGYDGGFVEHYVIPVLYPAALDRDLQVVLAGLVLGVNLLVYGWVARVRWRQRSKEPPASGPGHKSTKNLT